MRGRALLPVAQDLIRGQTPGEPKKRTAINRAYYAAYSEAGAYLRQRNWTPPANASPHDATWNRLRTGVQDADPVRRARRAAVADIGFLLKARRQKADYRLTSVLARDEAASAVKEAQRIIQELDQLDAAAPAA